MSLVNFNPILDTDSYKASHFVQYPPGTEYVYSYIESRGSDIPKYDSILFFGLQAFIKSFLLKPVTMENINEAEEFWKSHGEPFSRDKWVSLVHKHKGYYPVEIKAVPEGMVINQKNVLATIVNTDPEFYWLTSYVETALLRAIWYPSTVATISWECKQHIIRSWERTSDAPKDIINFKLHDFGARGVSSSESAELGGMAHLVNFMGSDTVAGIRAAKAYYNEPMAGFSIPAAEHSTITSWGPEREVDAYRNMLLAFPNNPLVAVVSDSYDLWNAIENIWGKELKDEIIASGKTLVIRPDSGDPLKVPIEALGKLGKIFGWTKNSKGFRVLPGYIRVIQGDGINHDSIQRILYNLEMAGWAIDNIAFGMGGGLLQHVNRDTFKFAQKCSAVCINGEWKNVSKDPVTDPGKKSKAGRFVLVPNGDYTYATMNIDTGFDWQDILQTVYKDGILVKETNFEEVRKRAI